MHREFVMAILLRTSGRFHPAFSSFGVISYSVSDRVLVHWGQIDFRSKDDEVDSCPVLYAWQRGCFPNTLTCCRAVEILGARSSECHIVPVFRTIHGDVWLRDDLILESCL
jgi:hypothetical protein